MAEAKKSNTTKAKKKEVVTSTGDVKTKEPKVEAPVEEVKEVKKEAKKEGPKYPIGSSVFIHPDANADLNGFGLFPQSKKYAYTVEAYNPKIRAYCLRKLNLVILLPENLIISPEEHAHDTLNRRQF